MDDAIVPVAAIVTVATNNRLGRRFLPGPACPCPRTSLAAAKDFIVPLKQVGGPSGWPSTTTRPQGNNTMANDRVRRVASATSAWLNVPTTILRSQASVLRFWADHIEKFAQTFEKGAETVRSSAEQEPQSDRAA